MSNKVKSKRTLKNLYEDAEELIYSSTPEPSSKYTEKHTDKSIKSNDYKTQTEIVEVRNKIFGSAISKKYVTCSCNKCGSKVNGTLINMIFSPSCNVIIPFISYTCNECNHSGHRSVQEKALPTEAFEKYYF